MEGEGVKQAYCIVLFVSNGGRVTPKGEPIMGPDDRPECVDGRWYPARSLCTKAYDCHECELLQHTLVHYYKPEDMAWVCTQCEDELMKSSKERGIWFVRPGYYGEGYCQYPKCWRLLEHGEPRYSILRTLFVGPILSQ